MSREHSPEFKTRDEDYWKSRERADASEIDRILQESQNVQEGGTNIFALDAEVDQTGKADDAEDFADISDDDLPDEEPVTAATSFELPGLTDDGGTSHDTDDLFGENGLASSPYDNMFGGSSPPHHPESDAVLPMIRPETSFREQGQDHHDHHDHGLHFDEVPYVTNQDPSIPPATQNTDELIKLKYPSFRKDTTLNWNELLPPKTAKRKEKKPARKVKPLIMSKMSLDIGNDQEKTFRVPGANTTTRNKYSQDGEFGGLVHLGPADEGEAAGKNEFDLDESDDEPVAGLSLEHFRTLCYDFRDAISGAEKILEDQIAEEKKRAAPMDEWEAEFMADAPPKKKARVLPRGLPDITQFECPSLGSFQELTRLYAKRVILDHNDPHLHLIENEDQRPAKRRRTSQGMQRMANGNLGRDGLRRFNISNDEAYELLKEAHQDRVRATISNIPVEHSLPALKLAWPYYRTRLTERPDQFHRPPFRVRKFVGIQTEMQRRDHLKRKAHKGKARDVYRSTKQLSLMDNSTSVLFEYCERTPTVLSKFGMGNRIINYYRKKTNDDDASGVAKKEIGDSQYLLPEDRSPFARFGRVDPGETVPTLHNQMYRAPLFKHAAGQGSFVLGRNSTGREGARWYLRNIDHLYVVGQTFPYVEVPGPHSRKVTTTSKNRTQMIAFRMIKKHPENMLFTGDVTKHLTGTNDGQNRQKLKEFLQFKRSEKESGRQGYWTIRRDADPEKDQEKYMRGEEEIRNLIKPEDTCLLDGMNLGIKMLEDAGYDPRNANIQDDDDADQDGTTAKGGKKGAEKGEESMAEKMAPWKTTKAFIDASNNKAMLQLHGEGDPTGHGLGFSFIRTSMKGGYLEQFQNGPMSSSADAIEKQKRENNGHAYNVKKQDAAYEAGINEIWEKQKASLSDATRHEDSDILQIPDEDERFNATQGAPTPAAMVDDSVSQLSGFTSSSRRMQPRQLRITRQADDGQGNLVDHVEIVEDPVVIRQYLKRRAEVEAEDRDLLEMAPTGDASVDRAIARKLQAELEYLKKNRERRLQREQHKKLQGGTPRPGDADSPEPSAAERTITGTTRKCANCGQVGHIKTNKKLCPMLNGTKPRDNNGEQGGFGGFGGGSTGAASTAAGSTAASPPPGM